MKSSKQSESEALAYISRRAQDTKLSSQYLVPNDHEETKDSSTNVPNNKERAGSPFSQGSLLYREANMQT